MSHIVTIQTQIRDPVALGAACRRLGLDAPAHRRAKLFTNEAEGLCIELPHWKYPVVVDTAAGAIHYDNYGGQWGEQQELDRLLQAYAVEKATLEARRQGHAVVEQPMADGSIRLTVQVGEGGAA